MAKNITLMGADYPDVPAVQLPQTGGGTATFYDINVIDNLNSDSSTDALSAKQGKVLKEKINNFRKINIVGTTDSGGNKLVQTGKVNIISAYYEGHIFIPFHYNGNTYVKVLSFSTLQPEPNISIDGIATVIDDGIF